MYKLAIVIPAYKETFLNETLNSIANQSDKRFILYVGDDCSPYDLKHIVDRYKEKISIFYHRFDTNLGGRDLVGQWHRCIELTSNEEYIWLFSDDDIMDKNCVKRFYESLEDKTNPELFHFDIELIDDQNNGQIKSLPTFKNNLLAGEFLQLKLTGKIISFVVEFIFSRNLYKSVGGFHKFDLAWGSDFITWLKMSANTKKGIITIKGEQCKVKWRKSNENISPQKNKDIIIRKIRSLINNAKVIKSELTHNPDKYSPLKISFRWWRFPLGEIWRNRKTLSFTEQLRLCLEYLLSVVLTSSK